ncbi:MAG: cytochrome b/b6 domain-containing protein, partial [Steroidobacteraceae bacterium]
TASAANATSTAAGATTVTEPAQLAVRVWDLPVRVFHWALAGSFAAAYTLSESERWRGVHAMFGYTVLGLIAFRLLWGFIGTHYARFASFLFTPAAVGRYLGGLLRGNPQPHLGHNPAGSYVIYAMLLVGALTGASGYCTLNGIGGDASEELHEVLANGWLALVIVHVCGVVASSVLHRENLVRAMLSGYKRVAAPLVAGVAGTPARVGVGLAVALAVLGFWTALLLGGGTATASADPAGANRAEYGDLDHDGD